MEKNLMMMNYQVIKIEKINIYFLIINILHETDILNNKWNHQVWI